MLSIIDFAIISFALVHISIALLYFSPFVTNPEANWDSISLTSCSASLTILCLSSGITKSSMPIEEPDLVENS